MSEKYLEPEKASTISATTKEYLVKGSIDPLTPKEYIERTQAHSDVAMREKFVWFFIINFTFLNLTTMMLIFLDGFSMVSLNEGLLLWLGRTIFGQVVGLGVTIVGYLFKVNRKR